MLKKVLLALLLSKNINAASYFKEYLLDNASTKVLTDLIVSSIRTRIVSAIKTKLDERNPYLQLENCENYIFKVKEDYKEPINILKNACINDLNIGIADSIVIDAINKRLKEFANIQKILQDLKKYCNIMIDIKLKFKEQFNPEHMKIYNTLLQLRGDMELLNQFIIMHIINKPAVELPNQNQFIDMENIIHKTEMKLLHEFAKNHIIQNNLVSNLN